MLVAPAELVPPLADLEADLAARLLADSVELRDDIAHELATVVDLLGVGFALRKLLQPNGLPDELFGVRSARCCWRHSKAASLTSPQEWVMKREKSTAGGS
jgi:hypothetical protein